MSRLGGDFMPAMDEGDPLSMPSALPGLSVSKTSQRFQQTDRPIKSVPEVARVFGKAGRVDTAADPAPMEMFVTTIQFLPRDPWRPGMTPDRLVEELDHVVKMPGLMNVLVPPIRNRIGMLASGIKSPSASRLAERIRPQAPDRLLTRTLHPIESVAARADPRPRIAASLSADRVAMRHTCQAKPC
jgi:Cu(I)/Ag(I) efflux system membrane protein CusA/SilA